MGRIYIILGEPDSKDRYDMDNVVVPAQIWSYYGKKRPGLPGSFWIVFWKKDNLGEYKMYNPAADGPQSLLRQTRDTTGLDPLDYEANYKVILDEHPQLARASLTLLPNDMPYDFQPSLQSQQFLQRVIELPQNQINDSYATNFLKYKGVVDVDYSINYIESLHKAVVLKDAETGLDFVHFAIRPKSLSSELSDQGDSYSFSFDLIVSLNKIKQDEQDRQTIFEYRKNYPYSGNREEMLKSFFNSVIISDCFPVVEGDYRLSVLLQNRVNKEFTYFNKNISIKPGTMSRPVISGLLTTKEVKKSSRRVFLPFKFKGIELSLDPRGMYGIKDNVFLVFNVERGNYRGSIRGVIEVQDFFDAGKYQKEYGFEMVPGKRIQAFSHQLEPMKPGYYRTVVRLLATDGKRLDEKKEKFTVSVAEHISESTGIFKTTSFENRFLYYHVLGLQYMRLRDLEKAGRFLERAFNMRPRYGLFVKDFCTLLLMEKKSGRVLEVVENLKGQGKYQFDYYAIKGKAFFQKAEYKGAIENLVLANRIYDSDIPVLNVLGFSYLKTGNKEEAKEVFSASLRLDDRQKNIARILKEIK
jgi:tetratricopeptide (TPR) repeat protein